MCLNCVALSKPIKKSYRPELDVFSEIQVYGFDRSYSAECTLALSDVHLFYSALSSCHYGECLPILKYPAEFSICCMNGCVRN